MKPQVVAESRGVRGLKDLLKALTLCFGAWAPLAFPGWVSLGSLWVWAETGN